MPEPEEGNLHTAYVVDTSVFIYDPNCIDRFEASTIVVPLRVVEELDDVKSMPDARGAYARQASRVLEHYRHTGDLRKDGVPTEKGGTLFIAYGAESWDVLNGLGRGLANKNDNLILLVAKNWQKHNPEQRVVIVTQDINMRIKAAALGMEAEEYIHGEGGKGSDLYPGQSDILLEDDGMFQHLSSELHRQGVLDATLLSDACDLDQLQPNECCTIRSQDRTTLAIYKAKKKQFVFVPKPSQPKKGSPVRPKNDTQCFAHSLAMDSNIRLLTLVGKAGAGKTLMALLAAYEQLGKVYRRIIVYRPIYEVGGKELGYLPGDINKKFGPWARPILDNLELIFEVSDSPELVDVDEVKLGGDDIVIATDRGHISICPIIYIRGRSLHDSFVIVDEAQNLSPNDVKSLITRAGRGTKMVITGDPTQIDNRYLDSRSNGLVRAIRNFGHRKWDRFGHITMVKSERSELADIAAEIL